MIRPLLRLEVEDFVSHVDFILEFLKQLGWDPSKQEIDPRQIVIHPTTWGEICSRIRDRWGVGAALTWMNLGPSGDESNPYNLTRDEVKIGAKAFSNLFDET